MRKWIVWIGCMLLVACQAGFSEEERLAKRQAHAEERTALLCDALDRGAPIDSIRFIAEKDDELFFYIFDARQMVYWSSNRLAADEVYIYAYDTWRDMHFANAEAKARWTKTNRYNVLTVLPIRYTTEPEKEESKPFTIHTAGFYFYLCIALLGLVVLVGVWGLVRYKGIRNMPLSTRMMYVILACVLAVFIYIFVMSIRYVHRTYAQHQRHDLQMRSEYIQSYLRSLYYWDVALLPSQAQGLEVDLHDLALDMNQDMHVYSLSGELIASSTPSLFREGRLSRRMAPEALFAEDHSVLCLEQIGGHPYLVSYVPFHNGSFVTIGYIAVPYFLSEQTRKEEVDVLLARLLPPYIIVLILALLFSFWAARSMTAPIHLMIDKMRHFEMGAKTNHIEYPYHDELGELVERYNLLVDKVEESAEQLAKAERESAWRTMARQIAHEINNPLTPMKLSVQKLQLKRGTDQFDAYFDKTTKMLISEIDNLAHIAQSFSTFAKQPEVVTSEVDVAEKLSHVITLQRENDEQIPVRYVGPDSGVMGMADKEQISQVFVNIIRNAIQAVSGAGLAQNGDIIVVLNALYSEKEMEIRISDNGPGIPQDIQEKIFRPNFTTKSNGNGLGLAISKHIVEGSGGRIAFETSPKGTTFYIYLRKQIS
ncbi:MAG: hypothetical protein IKP57_05810 [Paludibacteraceae bacterium]|nr:hypothetical protein [Paludibacteraceae bacterium]